MAKRDYLKEMREGFEKWMRFTCYMLVLFIILDILPHLPDALGKRIVDKLLGLIGL